MCMRLEKPSSAVEDLVGSDGRVCAVDEQIFISDKRLSCWQVVNRSASSHLVMVESVMCGRMRDGCHVS
jgi:hypothetical protein